MNDTRTSGCTVTKRLPAMEAELTRIRGLVRRTPEGIQKQQRELLAAQLENGVPAAYIARQLEVMAGRSQH